MATRNHVRVGLIGGGRLSDRRAHEYATNPAASIVAIVDVNDRPDDADVDVVEILLPHHFHAEAALAAMDAGRHVSLQKPMTNRLRESA